MATSLTEQLKKLSAPQTAILLQDKKRPSLLFDPKEAANLDRETVFEIGQSGLQELIKLCHLFREFEGTLFTQSSMNLERSVQNAIVNQKLDKCIEKFLVLLSPYFLLYTAHKALEWLIHRFHIHQFNRDQLLMLILPYHETRMFVRTLQLLDLSDPGDKWHWLKPLQKPGVPLASITLVNRVSSDNGLLKLLCTHVVFATKVYADQASCLSTLYAFYSMAMVGAIDNSSCITEVQVNHMLPSLTKGLASPIPDFAASSYVILAKLTVKVRLNDETLEFLLLKAFKNPVLKQEVTLLLVFLYGTQINQMTFVPDKLIIQLSELPWFTETVAKIKSSGTNVSKFIVPLLKSSLRFVLRDPTEIKSIQNMINDILARVPLNDNEVDLILKNTLKSNDTLTKCSKESKDFLANLYRSLEKQYPVRFDEYLTNLMKSSETNSASKKMLHFLMSWHSGTRDARGSLDILDRLNHVSPEQRIIALQLIADGEVQIFESLKEMVNNALLARFNDDDVRVVNALLNFSTNRLKSLFTTDILINKLLILLSKCHTDTRTVLAKPALKILLKLCSEGDDTSVFIAALPYLFPNDDEKVDIAMQVLQSNFAKNNSYMQNVMIDVGKSPNAESVSSAAFHNILKWDLLPPTSSILSTMKQQICYGDAASMFFNMVLLGSVCRVPVGSLPPLVAREVIEMASEMIERYPTVVPLPGCNQLNGNKIKDALSMTSKGILPLQVGTYVLEMVHRRLDLNINPKLDFEADPDRSQLVLRLLQIFFNGMNNKQWRKHYAWCLQIFFQRHFPTSENMLRFLSQMFAEPIAPQTSFHCLQIALSVLDHSKSVQWVFQDNVFTPNLLLAAGNRNADCRKVAMKIMKKLSQTFNLSMDGFSALLHELAIRNLEISLDPDQLSLILYNLLSPDPDVQAQISSDLRPKLQEARTLLLKTVTDESIPIHIVSQLLDILTHVNGPTVLQQLTPLGIKLLDRLKSTSEDRFAGSALKNILQRFNSTTAKVLKNEQEWQLFEASMNDYVSRIIITDKGPQPPSIILMKQIDETFFDAVGEVSQQAQKKILSKLVDIVTDCEIGSVVTAASKTVRRIRIHAQFVVEELRTMKQTQASVSDKHNSLMKKRLSQLRMLSNPELFNSRKWKRGITLLEFIQRADNIKKEELLLPVLFELLRMCLQFEAQSPLEYTNQLLLSSIYNLATKSLPIPDAHLHVDLIAQCIRTSQNPQTHHHALLVLVELFKIANMESALHNIMPIFTFMGSSVLRQDDAYSMQIISKTIETIIPIMNAANNEKNACEVLRVFVTSLPDIPEHRRVSLFVKLLQLLENHMHLFYLLTFESHVLSQETQNSTQQMSSQRLEFALNISQHFSSQQIINVCVKLVDFMRSLPVDVDENQQKKMKSFAGKHIFDISNNSAKQLRHYKYTLVQFLSKLLSSPEFVNRVAMLDSAEIHNIKDSYDRLIVELIILIQSASKCVDRHQGKSKAKYWKVLLHHLYDVLDVVNSLLPNKMFVASIKHLIEHELLSVRRKALELLNARLQQRKFREEDHADLLTIIESLMQLIKEQGKPSHQEVEIIQQTTLISLKLLSKLLATDNPEAFKPVLELTTEVVQSRDGLILASAVLCIAELCSAMRIHAIQSLNKFFPAILHLLETHCCQEIPDIVIVSIVSALQKIVESVGNFLSLYLDQLLFELVRLNSLYTDTEHFKIGIVVSRLRATIHKLSNCIPLRVLLPAVSRTYGTLLSNKSYQCLGPLMNVLAESFTNIQQADLNAGILDLTSFFLKALQFREDVSKTENDIEIHQMDTSISKDIVMVEESTSKALVALVLKLSEATFRPLYYRLYDWAVRNPQHKQRNITFFRLSANIAECLKSLYVLFAGHFLKHAASLLTSNNLSITQEPQELTLTEEVHRIELMEAILLTLHRVFTYDAHNFVNQERFETLAQPIVDQLENTVGGKEEYERRARDLIVPCIASFAGATTDDSLHRQLVYQTLLKTRHTEPHVRSAALSSLVEIARKLSGDFMPLLPETVPFLAELLEDEDEVTEKRAQEAVRTLEEILGEPLQKYF